MAQAKKGTNTNKGKTSTKPSKPEGEKKPTVSMVERAYRSHSLAYRAAVKWKQRLEAWGKEDDKAQALVNAHGWALEALGAVKEELNKLYQAKWQPPKVAGVGGGAKKQDYKVDAQVWIRPKKHDSYKEAFGEAALGNLFIDRIVGTKMLVRIGPRAENGKVARVIGFVPKGDITTIEPKAAEQSEAA